MRWLCLHGRGTSAEIFEMQTARIREALGQEHEFVFINGTVATEPDLGAEAVADEFFGYVAFDTEQDRKLCDCLVDLIHEQGPFNGIMGFSEGGTMAATILLEDARHGSLGEAIKCAIFFSAAPPFDPDLIRQTGILKYACADEAGGNKIPLINIPTAHIWSQTVGVNEMRVHQSLAQLCNEEVREVFLHELGHDVPGSKSDKGLAGTLRAIEHVIENAIG
ncbi:serine hydrolase FSH [Xylariaceae sp. FL0662B]|nr:serine hydrolase FSH [Xylariaceae sp. FL0662B]